MKIRVLDTVIDLPPRDPEDPWYLDWVLKDPKGKGRSLAASQQAFASLAIEGAEGGAVLELFGGTGFQTILIQKMFAPRVHEVCEISPAAVDFLSGFEGVTATHLGDSFERFPEDNWDIIAADFGDLTASKLKAGQAHLALLDKVFSRGPGAVVLTDVAGPRIHLHRKTYEALLGDGAAADQESYLYALAGWVRDRYGYRLTGGGFHRGAAKLAFLGEAGPQGTLVPVSDHSLLEVLT